MYVNLEVLSKFILRRYADGNVEKVRFACRLSYPLIFL